MRIWGWIPALPEQLRFERSLLFTESGFFRIDYLAAFLLGPETQTQCGTGQKKCADAQEDGLDVPHHLGL
jgi:hypothetical protein